MQTTIAPYNAVTGRFYNGKNIARLLEACEDNRWPSGAFATYRQWLSVGRCVMKGQRAASRIARFADQETIVELPFGRTEKVKETRNCGGASVFALEQTEPLEGDDPRNGGESIASPDESTRLELDTMKAPAHTSSVPKPKASVDLGRLITKAKLLESKASACHADRLTNTPKRLAQAMSKRLQGDRLLRQAEMLRAIVSRGVPDELSIFTTAQLIKTAQEASIQDTKPTPNSHHSYYVETGDWMHANPQHVALRTLLDGGTGNPESERIQAEADLRFIDIPGFFPTPDPVIDIMLEQAGDLSQSDVLEPCAGKGDIVKRVKCANPDAFIRAYEINPKLADYCKSFVEPSTVCADFMFVEPAPCMLVSHVLMNPPFERDQAPAFVAHAMKWLISGGRLVSVMPANWSSKRAGEALIASLDANGASWWEMELDGGSFAGADSFRQTSVSVCLLIVDK